MKPPMYYKFTDSNGKYFIYEYIVGFGDMATYKIGKIVGKKTIFESVEACVQIPIGVLKRTMHIGHTINEYETLEDLEGELFLENLLDM